MTDAEKQQKLTELRAQLAAVEGMGLRIDPLAGPNTPNLVPPPGAGGWVPSSWLPLVAGIFASVCVSVGGVLLSPVISGASIAAAVLMGISTGVVGFFGIKSAGPRS